MNSDFISIKNARLRQVLRADLEELEGALEHGLHKASLILAGGIVEALLLDYLEGIGYEGPKGAAPAAMTLNDLIAACEQEGALTPQTVSQCHVLKQYRNIIHPGRAARYGEAADENGAAIAAGLVEQVAEDVEKRALQRPEWAAESVYRRAMPPDDFIDDRPVYLQRMVHALPAPEAERLMLEVIPERFQERLKQPGFVPEEGSSSLEFDSLLINCTQLVPLVLAEVSPAAASESARWLLRKMDALEEDEHTDWGDYNVWLYAFFSPRLLDDLGKRECDELFFYIAEDMEEGMYCSPAAGRFPNLTGTGAYLSPLSAASLVSALAKLTQWDEENSDSWQRVLVDEMALLPAESMDAARSAMDETVGSADSPESAALLSALRYEIWPLRDDEIPR